MARARALIHEVSVRFLESSLCGCCVSRCVAAAEADAEGGAPVERSGNEESAAAHSNCPPNSQWSELSEPDAINAECVVTNGPLDAEAADFGDGQRQKLDGSCGEEASGCGSGQPTQQQRLECVKSPSPQSSACSSLILALRKRFSIASDESSNGNHRGSTQSDRKGSEDVCAGSRQSLSQHRAAIPIPRVVILAEGQSEAESWKEASALFGSTDPSTPTRRDSVPLVERSSSATEGSSSQRDSKSGCTAAGGVGSSCVSSSACAGGGGDLCEANANTDSPASDREQVTPIAGGGGAMGCLGQTLIQTLFIVQTLSGVTRPEQRRGSEESEYCATPAAAAIASISSRERCNSSSQRSVTGTGISIGSSAGVGTGTNIASKATSTGTPTTTKSCIAASAVTASGGLSAELSTETKSGRSSRKASLNVSFAQRLTGRQDESAGSHSSIARTTSYCGVPCAASDSAAGSAPGSFSAPDAGAGAGAPGERAEREVRSHTITTTTTTTSNNSGNTADAALQACASSLCSSSSLKAKQGRGRRWVAKCKKIVLKSSWRKTPPDDAVRIPLAFHKRSVV